LKAMWITHAQLPGCADTLRQPSRGSVPGSNTGY
jgi:hypothetical protein